MDSAQNRSTLFQPVRNPLRIWLGLLFCALQVSSASALPINIIDCDGITRASKSVEATTRTEVKIDVTTQNGGVVDGVDVTLTNPTTGETLTATVENGVATFQEVSGGTWVMGSTTSDLFYSTIILQGEISAIAATSAAVGAGLVGGGAVAAGVVEVADGLSGDSSEPEPTPTPEPRPTGTPTPVPTPTPECEECSPDEEAPVIDDFFNAQKNPPSEVNSDTRQSAKSISPKNQPTEKRLNPDDCFIGDEVTPMSPFS